MLNKAMIAVLATLLLATTTNDVPAGVDRTIADITARPAYAHSVFGIFVADQTTGQTLIDRMGEKMFVAASIMKTYSTATALKAYGPGYRFRTPVYRTGTLKGGALAGDLILVASGDFSFGLRDRPDGTLAFNSAPEVDHNAASTGFSGPALLPNSDPLAAMTELAREVRARGIRSVRNVVIDDRLFAPYKGWLDGLISPIWINENIIDITIAPTSPGRPARVDWRPKTGSIRVVSEVKTVANESRSGPLTVEPAGPGIVEIRGEIAAGGKPALRSAQIVDPAAFARVAFTEALNRAGIAVNARASGPNPSNLLPSPAAYTSQALVAEHVSPPLSEFVKVILKLSYNRGADVMVCLVAVKAGSRDCADGLETELKTITALGVSPDSTIVYDGAGSDDAGRTSPVDEVTFLRNILTQPWGHVVGDGMSILGVDGNEATNQAGTPTAGKVRVKDGTRVAGSPSGQAYLSAKTFVGYMEAKSGRRLVYAVYLNNVPTAPASIFATLLTADRDVGTITAAIQQGY
ncbi:MAG: D-alanyl-D-alanine carboxypeptidase/D-alanyl-D-alanine-endopeptidase [Candidatus Cybelea sp.]